MYKKGLKVVVKVPQKYISASKIEALLKVIVKSARKKCLPLKLKFSKSKDKPNFQNGMNQIFKISLDGS